MGSFIEINDTLQITTAQGFPNHLLSLEKELSAEDINQIKAQIFSFKDKSSPRIFQLDPVRVYLVHNIDGKWLFWGKAVILNQSINKINELHTGDKPEDWVTSGQFKIIDIYQGNYQKEFTKRESPDSKSYF